MIILRTPTTTLNKRSHSIIVSIQMILVLSVWMECLERSIQSMCVFVCVFVWKNSKQLYRQVFVGITITKCIQTAVSLTIFVVVVVFLCIFKALIGDSLV